MKASMVIPEYNPYEVAKANKTVVILEPLGNILGYYNKVCGQKFIHINDKLPMDQSLLIASHLLYPALINQDEMYFVHCQNLTRTHLEHP